MSNPKVDEAAALFKEGFACSQAVFSTFAGELGLNPQTARKIADPFGAGMTMAETCGAVSGALMAIGLKYGRERADDSETKEKMRALVRTFLQEFKACHGSVLCRDLLGCDISSEQGLAEARAKELFDNRCPGFVRTAAESVEKLL